MWKRMSVDTCKRCGNKIYLPSGNRYYRHIITHDQKCAWVAFSTADPGGTGMVADVWFPDDLKRPIFNPLFERHRAFYQFAHDGLALHLRRIHEVDMKVRDYSRSAYDELDAAHVQAHKDSGEEIGQYYDEFF